MSGNISAWQRCPVRLYLQLFVGRPTFYWCYLCMFVHRDVQHGMTIWVIWRVSLFTPVLGGVYAAHLVMVLRCFLLWFCLPSSCVLSVPCCQCFWIVNSVLPFLFSITLHTISYKICNKPVECFLLSNSRRDVSYRLKYGNIHVPL